MGSVAAIPLGGSRKRFPLGKATQAADVQKASAYRLGRWPWSRAQGRSEGPLPFLPLCKAPLRNPARAAGSAPEAPTPPNPADWANGRRVRAATIRHGPPARAKTTVHNFDRALFFPPAFLGHAVFRWQTLERNQGRC